MSTGLKLAVTQSGTSSSLGVARPWESSATYWPSLTQATVDLPAPVAMIDIDALAYNANDLLLRAQGVPIRVASKSIRVREVLNATLALPGYAGVLAFTLSEALWLAGPGGIDDVVLGYPTADRAAIEQLCADEQLASRITLMVDDPSQLDLVDSVKPPGSRPTIRLAIDADASWRAPKPLGHIGVRRSPLYSPREVEWFARQVMKRDGFALVGLMMYEAQIAGQGDATGLSDPMIRWVQKHSGDELLERRGAIVRAVKSITELEFVNGGGTGSLEYTSGDLSVTEVTAGSGLLAGHLFDGYQSFTPAPAAAFALDVVRKPLPEIATVLGGGWIASGPALKSRLPKPVWPDELKMLSREGAGEVQTPLRGNQAKRLKVGDRIWFRHCKSGELAERVNSYHLVSDGAVTGEALTYRGEGKAFL